MKESLEINRMQTFLSYNLRNQQAVLSIVRQQYLYFWRIYINRFVSIKWPFSQFFVFQSFDDETKSIRAQTAALLKRIHEPLPRATKTFPISVSRYDD